MECNREISKSNIFFKAAVLIHTQLTEKKNFNIGKKRRQKNKPEMVYERVGDHEP